MKILSLGVTSSSAWIVTLALKTCTFLARLSLVKDSLKNETAFGSTEKLCSQQQKRKKENGRPLRKAASLLAVGELCQCAHCTHAAPASAVPEGLFYFGLLLGQQMVLSPCKREIFLFVCFGLAL